MSLTQAQIENIQIDHGIVYLDYGLATERRLAPTKGGGTFSVQKNIRDIEYDGRKGKTKGAQVVDEINCMLTVPLMDTSMENLAFAMPYLDFDNTTIKAKSTDLGLIQSGSYATNITLFAKVVGGGYKKIQVNNPMTENDFSIVAAPKTEGVISLEVNGHWDATDDAVNLFEVEDIASISDDTDPPTCTTVPTDTTTNVAITVAPTATFNEAIIESDANVDNVTLIKVSDGTDVAGAVSYAPSTKTLTFTPTSNLANNTAYILMIANIRDIAGNKMVKKLVNFTTIA